MVHLEKVTKLQKTKTLKDTFLSASSFLFIHFGLVGIKAVRQWAPVCQGSYYASEKYLWLFAREVNYLKEFKALCSWSAAHH